jgi:hypothetical protein
MHNRASRKKYMSWKKKFLSLSDGILHSPEKPVCEE